MVLVLVLMNKTARSSSLWELLRPSHAHRKINPQISRLMRMRLFRNDFVCVANNVTKHAVWVLVHLHSTTITYLLNASTATATTSTIPSNSIIMNHFFSFQNKNVITSKPNLHKTSSSFQIMQIAFSTVCFHPKTLEWLMMWWRLYAVNKSEFNYVGFFN